MIEVSKTLQVNDGSLPTLSGDDVWAGLVEKAANPLSYVRTHGTARGAIANEIAEEAGEPVLTFRFRIDVDGVEAGSP
ncbi:hypothetical protein [Pseudonocardia sp. ICBG1034]|uniref:hypothetical protein n=1 Tax=Pseudonocardia sp. ICBG1034 TaxID=2844381 RepID=UPI001CC92584|nr:hypothetical protein [Pseudonocardia sp. ICBG1034]